MIPPGARLALTVFALVVCGLGVAPVLVIVLESFTATDYVVFPPRGFSLKWYGEFLKRPEFVESVVVSTVVAVATCVAATALGTMASIAIHRHRLPGSALVQALLMMPLSLPGLILGFALLQALAAYHLPRNVLTMTLTHIVITMPFAIRFVSVALQGVDPRVEQAAQSLGASPGRTFREITLPLIRPGVVSSIVFTFILSFDEVAASLFVASPTAMTLPVRIFVYIDQNYDPLITSVSSLLVFAALAALVIIERTIGMGRLFGLRQA